MPFIIILALGIAAYWLALASSAPGLAMVLALGMALLLILRGIPAFVDFITENGRIRL